MMKVRKKKILWISLVALVFVVTACGKSNNMNMGNTSTATSNSASNEVADGEVNVVASNWKWELSKTTFKVGETVTFSIKGEEGMHGFAIDGTDIDQKIAPGETATVTWTPDKAGEFTIKCSIMCGTGHADMTQVITVDE